LCLASETLPSSRFRRLTMLLAIDTATQTTGVCLADGARVIAEHVWHSGRYHTVELAPEVAMLLQRNQVALEDLEAVAVASGPGSYTGLRIGMALAKGIVLARRIPLVGVPTLDILAAAQPPSDSRLLALIAAGRGRFAAVWYKWGARGWRAKSGPENVGWDELISRLDQPCVVCGELDASQRSKLEKMGQVGLAPPALSLRRPSFLAEVARAQLRVGKGPDAAALAPIYLGDVEAAP
jgi:tRNA threonylcarbamoyladenosine biosynthesis protein TsaB